MRFREGQVRPTMLYAWAALEVYMNKGCPSHLPISRLGLLASGASQGSTRPGRGGNRTGVQPWEMGDWRKKVDDGWRL